MKVTILGVGGLGSALAKGLSAARDGSTPVSLTLCDRHPAKVAPFAAAARLVDDPATAVAEADVVLLAVKPKGTAGLAASLLPAMRPDALLVSCAAGIPLAAFDEERAVARAMPSIGAAKGASTTAVLLGPGCDRPRDLARLQAVFSAAGSVREVPDEVWLHAVTAVAASGPAFLLLAVEALADGAVEAGLPRADAVAYAASALRAAAARLDDGVEPQSVRALVTSPAGTTAAGLAVLERGAVRGVFLDAVRAAVARSRERMS
jgi:pyrroline-5-carboxylate reductase